MIKIEELENFVKPFYNQKDIMHNLSHIRRILKIAKTLSKKYKIDKEVLIYGAYFHGIIYSKEEEIKKFLKTKEIPNEKIDKIVIAAWESQKDSKPKTIEGKILHDAHLIEGGKTFLIVKSLITGTIRGQTLEETISYIEENLIGKFKCYLPEAQKIYKEKERFTKEFLKDLKKNL
jgi:uncharacterized protein